MLFMLALSEQAQKLKLAMQPAIDEIAWSLRGLGRRKYNAARTRYLARAGPDWLVLPTWQDVNAQLARIFLESGSVLSGLGAGCPTHSTSET